MNINQYFLEKRINTTMDKNSEINADWKTLQMRHDMRKYKANDAHKVFTRRFPIDFSKHFEELGDYVDYLEGDEMTKYPKNENKNYNIMTKKLIRLTESDLHRIVKESVNRILIESQYNDVKYIVKEHWYCGHSSGIKEYVYYDKVKAQNHVIKYNDDHKFSKSYATVETIVPRDPVADRAKENVARFIKRDWQKFHP